MTDLTREELFLDEFRRWVDTAKEEVQHVYGFLSVKLSDEPEGLIQDLENAEAWNARMGFFLADANNYLDRAIAIFLPSKSKEISEAERKSIVDSKVAPIRQYRDYLESLCNSIKQRLILGESILGYQKQFSDHKHKVKEVSIY